MIPLCASVLGAALLCGTVLLCGTTAQASEPASNEQVIPNPAQTGSLTIAFTNEAGEPDKFGNKFVFLSVTSCEYAFYALSLSVSDYLFGVAELFAEKIKAYIIVFHYLSTPGIFIVALPSPER